MYLFQTSQSASQHRAYLTEFSLIHGPKDSMKAEMKSKQTGSPNTSASTIYESIGRKENMVHASREICRSEITGATLESSRNRRPMHEMCHHVSNMASTPYS
jgi:hypothetical protein